MKKLLKKGLTNEITFGMIIKLLANEVHTEQTNANLENDTEQKRNAKRQMIPMSEDLQREQRI